MAIDHNDIESYVEDSMHFGMTHEQIKNFVVNSHVTDSRKLRQVMTEISTRNHERKKLLFELGDAYLALPGGTGTLEEIVEVVSWKVMRIHNKPIIFFNKNNFWDNLFQQFKFFEDENFSNKNLQNSFHIIDTVDQLKNILIKWQK